MNDDNVVKFQPRKPKPAEKPAARRPGRGLIWLAALAAVALVWAYYQFLAPQTV